MGTPRTTDRECHHCGEATYLKDGHEMYCPNCAFAPHASLNREHESEWDAWWNERREAATRGERVYMVGGHPMAYITLDGEPGEYEYSPSDGFLLTTSL